MSSTLGESRLGKNLKEALHSDFFQFFHLRVAHQEPAPEGGGTVSFRPESPQFRDLVAVTATVDPAARFNRLILEIDRSIIDTQQTEAQARDIVKSFLADATPVEDLEHIVPWVRDIQLRPTLRSGRTISRGQASPQAIEDVLKSELEAGRPVTVWMGQRPGEQAPAGAATEAFETFAGETESCELQLQSCTIRLRNVIANQRSMFQAWISAL